MLFFKCQLGLGVGSVFLWLMIPSSAFALEGQPLQDLSTAEMLVLKNDLALARRYLHPGIYSPHISGQLRSRFYYVKGYTFMKEGLHVSAGKDFYRALEFDPSNSEALYCLGQLYYHGRGYEEDAQMGLSFFREAADFSHQDAKFYLAYALLIGKGTEQNEEEGRSALSALAAEGHIEAMMHLADHYRKMGYDQSRKIFDRIKDLYERALKAGSAEAALSLGVLYKEGKLVARDLGLAFQYFTIASEMGNLQADVHIAHSLAAGLGIERDYVAARRHYLEAADNDLVGGFKGLGYLYEFGLGVPTDLVKARAFYDLGRGPSASVLNED